MICIWAYSKGLGSLQNRAVEAYLFFLKNTTHLIQIKAGVCVAYNLNTKSVVILMHQISILSVVQYTCPFVIRYLYRVGRDTWPIDNTAPFFCLRWRRLCVKDVYQWTRRRYILGLPLLVPRLIDDKLTDPQTIKKIPTFQETQNLWSSMWILCSVGRWLFTDVSGQTVTPIIKVQAEFLLDYLNLGGGKGGQSMGTLKKSKLSKRSTLGGRKTLSAFTVLCCCPLWPVRLCHIFPHFHINGIIFGIKLLNKNVPLTA